MRQLQFALSCRDSHHAFLAGIDDKVTDDLVAGLSVRHADGSFDFDNNRGDMSGESWGVIGYGSYNLPNGVFIDGSLGYASNSYELRRQINFSIDVSVASQTAKSDPDAAVWDLNIGTG